MLESIWRSPLVPVAFAATGGILLDRWLSLPILWTLLVGIAAIGGTLLFAVRNRTTLAALLLWTAVASLGAAYHHLQRDVYASDDIGELATLEPQPVLLRGIVETQPLLVKHAGNDELRSFPAHDQGRFVLQVTAVKQQSDWESASGRLQVLTASPLANLRIGDEVEIAGRIEAPSPPANPGEFDYASMLRDQRI